MANEAPATPTMRGQFPSRPAEVSPSNRRSRVVGALAALACILPPWLVGAWETWSQWTTFALAVLAFAALFTSMLDYRLWPPSTPARVIWWRLRHFPIFWIGLAILVYGVIAALNPWRVLVVDNQQHWLNETPHIRWLPHGVDAPFWQMNAWRALVIIAPAWLVTCAIWVGIETEKTLRMLITAVAANGAALALFGIIQRLSGTREMFWVYDPRPEYAEPAFFGSFIYSGHAAAWIVLAFGAAAAVLDQRLLRRNPLAPERKWARPAAVDILWLGGLAVMLVALGEFVKPDFWILAPGIVLGVWAGVWIARLWRAGRKRQAALYALPAMVFVAFTLMVAFVGAWEWRQGGLRYPELEVNPRDPALPVRYVIARTSIGMIKSAPLWGWGPGSYRYVAPDYLKKNPLFTYPQWPDVLRYRANHAHSDWVQIVAEWGLAGASLFAAAFGWWVWMTWWWRRGIPGEMWCVLGAVACIIIGALADFPLYNPAVLIALGVLLSVSLKLAEVTQRRAPVSQPVFFGL